MFMHMYFEPTFRSMAVTPVRVITMQQLNSRDFIIEREDIKNFLSLVCVIRRTNYERKLSLSLN